MVRTSTNMSDEKKYVGKFFGPRKIESLKEIAGYKTAGGVRAFTVTYDGGFIETLTELSLAAATTDEAKDFNFIQDRRFEGMVPKVLSIMNDYDLPAYQLNAFFQKCLGSLQANFDRALQYKWTGDDSRYVPGSNPTDDVTLVETDIVLKKIADEKRG